MVRAVEPHVNRCRGGSQDTGQAGATHHHISCVVAAQQVEERDRRPSCGGGARRRHASIPVGRARSSRAGRHHVPGRAAAGPATVRVAPLARANTPPAERSMSRVDTDAGRGLGRGVPSRTSGILAVADVANLETSAAAAIGRSSRSARRCRTPGCTGAADPLPPAMAHTRLCSSGRSSIRTYRSGCHSFLPHRRLLPTGVTLEVAYPHPTSSSLPIDRPPVPASRPPDNKALTRQSTLDEPTSPVRTAHLREFSCRRRIRGTPAEDASAGQQIPVSRFGMAELTSA